MRNTIGLHRGYTGHEMLKDFGIINMNGRLYDPVLGRFFSPDNYVQLPDNSQSFNRYSYCLNNPLKYTDPSGNLFGIDDAIIAFAFFNMASSMMQASFNGQSVWKAGALSLLSSAASYGIGAAFENAGNVGHELLRAGAHGLASGVVSALDGGNFASAFVSGAAASGIGSYAQSVNMNSGLMVASTTVVGGTVAWITGGDFLQGAMQGMQIGLLNHAMHDGEKEVQTIDGGELPGPTVVARRIYKLPKTILMEKPLEPVYPEFGVIFAGRALLNEVAVQFLKLSKDAYRLYRWSGRTVQFGNNPNQVRHTFRHTRELGLGDDIVRESVLNDVRTLYDTPLGDHLNRVVKISGKRIQYTIYKRQQGDNFIYNIGRIHEE